MVTAAAEREKGEVVKQMVTGHKYMPLFTADLFVTVGKEPGVADNINNSCVHAGVWTQSCYLHLCLQHSDVSTQPQMERNFPASTC